MRSFIIIYSFLEYFDMLKFAINVNETNCSSVNWFARWLLKLFYSQVRKLLSLLNQMCLVVFLLFSLYPLAELNWCCVPFVFSAFNYFILLKKGALMISIDLDWFYEMVLFFISIWLFLCIYVYAFYSYYTPRKLTIFSENTHNNRYHTVMYI